MKIQFTKTTKKWFKNEIVDLPEAEALEAIKQKEAKPLKEEVEV